MFLNEWSFGRKVCVRGGSKRRGFGKARFKNSNFTGGYFEWECLETEVLDEKYLGEEESLAIFS